MIFIQIIKKYKKFNYALEDIPLKEENDLANWDKRKFNQVL